MIKVILFAFIVLSLVSCNSSNSKSERRNHKDSSVSSEESGRINRKDPKFEESDWEDVKDRFTVDDFIDVTREKMHEDILAKKYSKAYQRGEYKDHFKKKVTILEYLNNASIYGNDEKWSDALDKLYVFAKEQKLTSSTLEQLPSKAGKLGDMERILAEEMVRYIGDEYPAPFKLNFPEFYSEAGELKVWRFDRINIDGTKKTYQLFKQNGDWHWQ